MVGTITPYKQARAYCSNTRACHAANATKFGAKINSRNRVLNSTF